MKKQQVSSPTTAASELSRRDFLKLGIGTLGALAVLEVGGAGLLFLEPRSLEGDFGGIVNAGPADSFVPGSVTEFPDGRFFLIRAEDGGFLAVSRRCTHLGCSVSWQSLAGQFFCPCHASTFDGHGDALNPPAPRALDTFPVQIEDGQVVVNTGRSLPRDNFTADQLAYA